MATGKRAGARRATPARSTPRIDGRILGHAAGITACVVAWGYLVYMAIDFGGSARSGESGAWLMLGLAFVGAMSCLFAGLMLAARLTSILGLSKAERDAPPPSSSRTAPAPSSSSPTPPPSPEKAATPVAPKPRRQPGGRRIARR